MHRKQSFDQQRRQQHHTLVPVGLQDKVRDYRTQRGPPAVCHLTRNGTADRFRKAKTSSNRTMPAMILSPGPREKRGGMRPVMPLPSDTKKGSSQRGTKPSTSFTSYKHGPCRSASVKKARHKQRENKVCTTDRDRFSLRCHMCNGADRSKKERRQKPSSFSGTTKDPPVKRTALLARTRTHAKGPHSKGQSKK